MTAGLIASDLLEAVISAVAFTIILLAPSLLVPALIVYLLVTVASPVITDVVEEFYGQQLVLAAPDEAMTFNTSIYSILAFIGLRSKIRAVLTTTLRQRSFRGSRFGRSCQCPRRYQSRINQ